MFSLLQFTLLQGEIAVKKTLAIFISILMLAVATTVGTFTNSNTTWSILTNLGNSTQTTNPFCEKPEAKIPIPNKIDIII